LAGLRNFIEIKNRKNIHRNLFQAFTLSLLPMGVVNLWFYLNPDSTNPNSLHFNPRLYAAREFFDLLGNSSLRILDKKSQFSCILPFWKFISQLSHLYNQKSSIQGTKSCSKKILIFTSET
jgi:hypothetical protein